MSRASWTLSLLVAAGILVWVASADAQQKAPVTSSPAQPSSSTAPASIPTGPNDAAPNAALPLTDIADNAETTRHLLHEITADLSPNLAVERIEAQMADQYQELVDASSQTTRVLQEAPQVGKLIQLNWFWKYQLERLDSRLAILNQRGKMLDEDVRRLEETQSQWRAALQRIESSGSPADLQARVVNTLEDIRNVMVDARKRESNLLSLQNRIVHQQGIATEALRSLGAAREQVREKMLRQDAPPLWESWETEPGRGRTGRAVSAAIAERFAAMRRFARVEVLPLSMRLVLFLAVWFFARRLSRRVRDWASKDTELLTLEPLFHHPLALALFVVLLSLFTLFPIAPPTLEALTFGLLCVTNLQLLLPVAGKALRPFIVIPGLLLLFDRFRILFDGTSPDRVLLMVQTVLAIAGVSWLVRRCWRGEEAGVPLPQLVRFTLKVSVAVLIVSLVANLFGFVTLATVLGQGVVLSLFLATLLLGVVWVTRIVLRASLLTNSNRAILLPPSVEDVFYQRVSLLLGLGALALWTLLTLDLFVIRDFAMDWVNVVLTTPLQARGFGFTLGDVLLFILVVVLAFLIAGMIRAILQDGVLPVMPLQRGVPNTIATISYYVILLFGFLFAAAAGGMQLDKFTLFVSAFSVGLGFGLQNVVNNFVSGLILLFERPIQIGDTVELAPLVGTVQRIGLRSISVRTLLGAEVIVPNSILVNAQLINWTRSDPNRRVDLPVNVAAGPEPEQVMDILRSAAASLPHVLDQPAPAVLINQLGKDSLAFVLQFWVLQEHLDQTRSEVVQGISNALKAAELQML